MTHGEAKALRSIPGLPAAIVRARDRVLDSARKVRVKAGERKGAPASLSRSELRELALEREGHKCAVCPRSTAGFLLSMHHIIRRDEIGCVAMLCWWHHDEKSHDSVHAGDLATLRTLAAYCVKHEMSEAAHALARRIAKIEDRAQSYPKGRKGTDADGR